MKTLYDQLKLHEGYREKPYRDTNGKITIGIGHNLTDNGLPKNLITELFWFDLDRALADCKRAFPWFERLDSVRQKVLVDMCFNLGLPKLQEFVHTLQCVEEGRYVEAGHAMLRSAWANQVGRRAERLAEMMMTGEDYKD